VDDTPENLRLLAGALLEQGYKVCAFPSGPMALRAVAQDVPDLVLLDINMPEMDGFEVCARLKANKALRDVPVIFISAVHEIGVKLDAFKKGGVDYITKPFQLDEVFARVATHLELKQVRDILKEHNVDLTQTVSEQLRELSNAQAATIVALAKLSQSRDDDTGLHVERMGTFSGILAAEIEGRLEESDIDERFAVTIVKAAVLHDIGKVGIPDDILLKPGKLTPAEFEIMKQHTVIGHQTLEAVLESYPRNLMVQMGADIARSHHERWDGSGYPDALAGNAIPLSARIVAVADVYDALRSRRPYKEPFTHEDSSAIIFEGRGRHFDPTVVDAFEAREDDMQAAWHFLQGDPG
jgi:putative two-component system response regulator